MDAARYNQIKVVEFLLAKRDININNRNLVRLAFVCVSERGDMILVERRNSRIPGDDGGQP